MTYKLTLGLEIHIQVNAAKKMFCGCDANIWQSLPNTHVCPVCLGLPGALPVPNFEAVQKTQLLGLALNCALNKASHFDRKHYFYPDLPKGYQISQYKEPLCGEGYLELDHGKKAVIERIHLEEDTAKSLHEGARTLIDFNKSGIALIEVVTTPCFNEISDTVDFCKKIQDIARVLGVSDADMEKGNMRLEANISLRTEDMENRGELAKYKVEVKNINSFRFMEKAVAYEVERQIELLKQGETPKQENRGWSESKKATVPQRDKEEAHDYRYFPEPDIPPMVFTADYFTQLKSALPELPADLKKRLVSAYGLSSAAASFFSAGSTGMELSKKLEEVVRAGGNAQAAANLLVNKPACREKTASELTEYLKATTDRSEVSADYLENVAKEVLAKNQDAVKSYKSGKQSSLEFLVGQTMRELKERPDVAVLRQLLSDLLVAS